MDTRLGTIDIGIVIVFFIVIIVLGFISNRQTKTSEDYFIAGKKLGTFSIATMWMSSWIGGASIIGTSANGYNLGITGLWYVTGLAAGCVIFGLTFTQIVKRSGDKNNSISYADFIEVRYDKKTKLVVAVSSFISQIGYLASQFVAMAAVLNIMTGWDISMCYIITFVVNTAYTAFGGLFAVTYTTWVTFTLTMLGVVAFGIPYSTAAIGDVSQLMKLPAEWFNLGRQGWGTILALAVSSIMSFYTSMDSYTRCFAAKSKKVARNGALWAGLIVFVISVSATYIGMAAKVAMPNLEGGGNGAFAAMIMNFFPSGVQGLVIVGILAAIMDTSIVCILMGSANVAIDIYKGAINPDAKDKNIMKLSIISSILIGFIALLLSVKMPNIIDLLLLAFTVSSGCLFFPTVLGMVWKKPNGNASFISMVCSLGIMIVWFIAQANGVGGIFELDALWPGLIVSLLSFILMTIYGGYSTVTDVKR